MKNLYGHLFDVEVTLPGEFIEWEYYEINISINYVINNQMGEYRTKIGSMAEG